MGNSNYCRLYWWITRFHRQRIFLMQGLWFQWCFNVIDNSKISNNTYRNRNQRSIRGNAIHHSLSGNSHWNTGGFIFTISDPVFSYFRENCSWNRDWCQQSWNRYIQSYRTWGNRRGCQWNRHGIERVIHFDFYFACPVFWLIRKIGGSSFQQQAGNSSAILSLILQ